MRIRLFALMLVLLVLSLLSSCVVRPPVDLREVVKPEVEVLIVEHRGPVAFAYVKMPMLEFADHYLFWIECDPDLRPGDRLYLYETKRPKLIDDDGFK